MNRPANYNTKQREAVLAYVASLDGTHVTAAQVVEYFGNEEIPISRTTIYRHLDKLMEGGEVRKYTIDGITGACFQYVDKDAACQEHFHLKCECCGELLHLQCDTLEDVKSHVLDRHDFEVNTMKTVLYGKCRSCLQGV